MERSDVEDATVGPKERGSAHEPEIRPKPQGRISSPTPPPSVEERREGRAGPDPRLHLCRGSSRHRTVRPTSMNPRDFKKAAPYLGAILLAAVVFTVVRSLL